MTSFPTGASNVVECADATSLHVPSIGLIAAGEVVYNGIHPHLAETTEQTRLDWITALDRLEALEPRAVVAGHTIPEHDDDPRKHRRDPAVPARLHPPRPHDRQPARSIRRDDRPVSRARQPGIAVGRRERRQAELNLR
jgi:hypothetical protein